MDEKQVLLHNLVADLRCTAVAFSGGTDSSLLLAVCLDVLGKDRVLALTADSPLTPQAELQSAVQIASMLGARHLVFPTADLANERIAANPPDRCYHCKFDRFSTLLAVARRDGLEHLVHGENADDVLDYRPGSRAAAELRVRAPLREAGLTKIEVRSLAQARGLPNWNLPANACLASRFPYGTRLTSEGLARVEAAEQALKTSWRLDLLRVRDHFPVARIEVPEAELSRLIQASNRRAAEDLLRPLGYRYVTLDLSGYRMGSLNDGLEIGEHR